MPSTKAVPAYSDPCSFNYIRNVDAPGSSGSGRSSGTKDSKESKSSRSSSVKSFFTKRLFKKKPFKRSVAPVAAVPELPPPHQMHPHQTDFLQLPEAGEVAVSVESLVVPHTTLLEVHSYLGEVAPAAVGDSVRFAHPTVQSVRPITPLSLNASQISVASTHNSWPAETSPAASIIDVVDTDKPLRPKTIWRSSDMFKTPEGDLVSYRDFKKQLDGLSPPPPADVASPVKKAARPASIAFFTPTKPTASCPLSIPISERPPSLSFIPSIGTFTLDDAPVFADTDSLTPQPLRIQKDRNTALNALEGGDSLVPGRDLHPSILMPPRFPAALTAGHRPFSCIETLTEKAVYQAFNPSAGAIKPILNPTAATPAVASGRKTPDFLCEKPVDHLGHYARIESGVFDVPAITTPRTTNDTTITAAVPHKPLTSPPTIATDKPIPPNPSSATVRNSLVPTPLKMNDNGFPVIGRKSATREAKAKRETVARPVSSLSTMTLDAQILSGLEQERRELECKIEKQAAKVERKRRARVQKGGKF